MKTQSDIIEEREILREARKILKRRKEERRQNRATQEAILDGICEICHKACKAHTDHDYKTGKDRGTVCQFCKWGIGHFEHDAERLKAAIKYLETYGEQQ